MYLIYKINLPRGDLSENPVGDTHIFIGHTLSGDITKIKSFPGVSIFHLSACFIASSLFAPRATRHLTRTERKWHRLREVPHFLMDSRPRSERITRVRVIATREEGDTRKEFSLLPPRLASPRARGVSREPACCVRSTISQENECQLGSLKVVRPGSKKKILVLEQRQLQAKGYYKLDGA